MSWPDHAIWWHVYPLGFLGAEGTALKSGDALRHRLPVIADWLDHLIGLGCNGLALGPVFAAETHGYDTVDHFRVDPRLGDETDLVRLIEQSEARGVRVLLDGVFNHVGRSFPAFADVMRNGADSPYANWFHPDRTGHRTFEGHRHLVTLNHADPEVADYVTDVMNHWLDRGAAGWRLDAAYAVPRAFWRTVIDRVRTRHPDAWFSGEVIHGDYAAFVREGGLDSVTQYELWKAIWSSINDRNLHELAWALKRHNTILESFTPQTFIGNHDVTRIASRLHNQRHLAHAIVLLLTVGGVPSIYAGDELAFLGVKEEREGGDDAIRPAFPLYPPQLSSGGLLHYRLHQLLVGIRRRHPWLVHARTQPHTLSNTNIAYTLNDTTGHTSLAVALNLDDKPAMLTIPAADWHRAAGPGSCATTGQVHLPGDGWVIASTSEPRESPR